MSLIDWQDENKVPNIWKYEIKDYAACFSSSVYMKKNILMVLFVVSILILASAMPAYCADSDSLGIKVYCNGDFKGSTAYIDPASGVGMVPLALIQSLPGLHLDVRDNKAWFAFNGRQLNCTMGSDTYTMDGQSKAWRCGLQLWQYGIAVPGRDLFEALGASVLWDGEERAIYITAVPTPVVPKNLSETSLPLRLAFIQDEQLWLLDASKPGAQPLLVPSRNLEQIIGWSHDGKWLAYLQRTGDDKFLGDENLWVVSSDGQKNQCLDALPIAYNTPVWSPTDDTIAYQVQIGNRDDFGKRSLRIASQKNVKWQFHELVRSMDQPLGLGLAWFPDGQRLVVSWVHDEKNLPRLERVDLEGRASCLFILPATLAGDYQDGMFIWDINGLRLSPDGRYVACFLGMNSASTNADGMSLQIIDLQQRTSVLNLGCALGYPEWVAWSPDSQKIAAILGCGRVASTNKRLDLVQTNKNEFNAQDLGEIGQVDSRPIWDIDGNALYFTRGQESEAWLKEGRRQEVQVTGQQILCRRDDRVQSLSMPGKEQADYPLSLSPDGQYLAMQRLDYIDLGTLYLINLKNGEMVKLMDNVQANAGFYGSYYPDGVSIHWNKKK